MLENYKHKYRSRGKWIYAPNDRCVRKGDLIVDFLRRRVIFPEYFYHYRPGGHVGALHRHIENAIFFRIDLEHFYYSVSRSQVTRAMRHWALQGADTFAKWSCVKNPYTNGPRYVTPIGFVQSPLLVSMVLMRSPIIQAIERAQANGVFISVYLDDFIGSHRNLVTLRAAYDDILQSCVEAKFIPNKAKLLQPSPAIVAFNCDLQEGSVKVSDERVLRFLKEGRSAASSEAFEEYRMRVASGNRTDHGRARTGGNMRFPSY